jgi:hypothetical protein
MARYDSNSTEADGQYPTTAWSEMGLPEQNFGSGAAGGSPTSSETDQGGTNEPGQYPARETFTGVTLGGTGAPGTSSVGRSGQGGPDTVTYSRPTFYKSETGEGGMEPGAVQETATAAVSGEADWTQANEKSYGPGFNMPGVEGNTPTPGSGQYQTGKGDVMYGGFLKGDRPSTSKHPSFSGPGT